MFYLSISSALPIGSGRQCTNNAQFKLKRKVKRHKRTVQSAERKDYFSRDIPISVYMYKYALLPLVPVIVNMNIIFLFLAFRCVCALLEQLFYYTMGQVTMMTLN